jgi:hypothetical protein
MKRLLLASLALMAIAIVGCMPSLHPLYSAENLTSLPGLSGTWEGNADESGPETWQFSQVDSVSYTLEYTENEAPGEFDTHIVKLGNHLFVDIAPIGPETENELYRGLLMPVHMFGRIWLKGDTLRIGWLDGDWLSQQIDSGLIELGCETMDEDRLITASTAQLQEFAQKYADDTLAFPPTVLDRVTP